MGMENRGSDVAASVPIADRASLAGVRRAIRSRLGHVDADPALVFDCLVAVTEAGTNALIHGTGEGGAPYAEIRWEIDEGSARFYVQDFSSQEWSMAAHPSASPVRSSAEEPGRKVGGYGLTLMRQLMDEVAIETGPDGTTVMMAKRLM